MGKRILNLLAAGILAGGLAFSNTDGAPAGSTGAPNENTCRTCHSGGGAAGQLRIVVTNGATSYSPGRSVRIRVTLQDLSATRWGFALSAKREASTVAAGMFAVPATPPAPVVKIINGGVTQTAAGSYRAQSMQASWEFDWTAPAAGTGTVRLYAAAVGANNDGSASGDNTYTASLSLSEASAEPPPAVKTGNTILPQFVFGGGWTSSLYFHNRTSTAVSIPVSFFADDATPLELDGSPTRTVQIAARGTARILAPNGSDFRQGWATFDLPAGVTGYGVFQQSVPDIADQEAVVPFAPAKSPSANLLFDESSRITAVALWYNGAANADIAVTARDESGAVLGTATITMTPGNKTAFAVIEKIPAIAGKSGALDFTAPAGSVAVLGLRFGGAAFTSIPAAAP